MKFVVMVERTITELAEVEIEATDANQAKHKANKIRETLDYTATDSDYSVVDVSKRLEGLPRSGLYGKYIIQKADGSPMDPHADYFVLRLDTDPVARRAALEYSYLIPDRELAAGLQERIGKYDQSFDDCRTVQFYGMEKPAVIKRLEDALVEERAAHNFNKTYYMTGGRSWEEICQKEWLKEARQRLHAEGKIGSGHVAASRLTDEQRRALQVAVGDIDRSEDIGYRYVLRAMMEEGKQ